MRSSGLSPAEEVLRDVVVNGEVATAMVQYLHDMGRRPGRAGVVSAVRLGGAVRCAPPQPLARRFVMSSAQVAAKARAKLPEAVNGRDRVGRQAGPGVGCHAPGRWVHFGRLSYRSAEKLTAWWARPASVRILPAVRRPRAGANTCDLFFLNWTFVSRGRMGREAMDLLT